MRVTSDLWVSALLRRAFSAGGFAAVLRKGAPEAGAVFVVSRDRLGQSVLYGPAPQASYDERKPDERKFQRLPDPSEAIDARIAREVRFDPDLWLVELEAGDDFVREALGPTTP